MKKILFILFVASLILPSLALAQSGPVECCKVRRSVTVDGQTYSKDSIVGPTDSVNCDIDSGVTVPTEKWGIVCAINTLNAAVDWIFVVLIVLAVVFTILGAFNIMMSQGDPGKVDSGRNNIMYAAIGLIAAFIARAIPSIVKAIMGY